MMIDWVIPKYLFVKYYYYRPLFWSVDQRHEHGVSETEGMFPDSDRVESQTQQSVVVSIFCVSSTWWAASDSLRMWNHLFLWFIGHPPHRRWFQENELKQVSFVVFCNTNINDARLLIAEYYLSSDAELLNSLLSHCPA